MKALSVRQPFAWLIVNGYKDIENRTWRTTYRGPLLIHAGQRIDQDAVEWLRTTDKDDDVVVPDVFPTGGIVGVVTLVDCVTEHTSSWFDGPIGWVLDDPGTLDLIPMPGRLGLFHVDVELGDEDGVPYGE